MKICGYNCIDSEKDGKSTHGVMVHRLVPAGTRNAGGHKSNGIFISDLVLANSSLSRIDLIECFDKQKELIIESYTENGYTNVVSIMIL